MKRNFLHVSGAHFYDTYQCSDGKWISIGSIEPQFYALLLEKTQLEGERFDSHLTARERWPELKETLSDVFKTKTREQWCELMEGSDVCFAPVLDMDEAIDHEHNRVRETFVDIEGVPQPAPAPRFSRTPGEVRSGPPKAGEHTESALADWGLDAERIEELRQSEAI